MTTLTNSFEGGSNGTTLTPGNTGGSSGNAFDAITISGAGAGLAFSNSHAAHGSLSMEMTLPSGVSAGAYASWTTSMGTQTKVWFRLYLFHTANPAVDTRIWQADISGSTLCGALFISAAGKLYMSASGGTAVITSTNTVPLNAWYRVEGFLTGNVSTGQVSFSLYDSPDSTTATETQTSSAAQNTGGSPNSFRYGDFTATTESSTFNLWIDDVGLSSTGALGPAVTAVSLVTATVTVATPAPTVVFPATVALVPATVTIGAQPVSPVVSRVLFASVAAQSGTDQYGNAYKDGFTVYDSPADIQVHVNGTVGAPAIELPTGVGSEAEHAAMYAEPGNVGAVNEFAGLAIYGPGSSFDNKQAVMQMTSASKNGANEASGLLMMFNGSVLTIIGYWDYVGLHLNSPGGQTWSPGLTQTDTSTGTATGTGYQNLTKIWSIPANDPNTSTTYRLTSGGTFSVGATVTTLTISCSAYSSNAIALPIGSAEFIANQSYWWRAQCEVAFTTTGASGAFVGALTVDIGSSTSNQATVTASTQTAGGFAAYNTASAINTTNSGSIALQAKWASTANSPTMSGKYSVLERLGP